MTSEDTQLGWLDLAKHAVRHPKSTAVALIVIFGFGRDTP